MSASTTPPQPTTVEQNKDPIVALVREVGKWVTAFICLCLLGLLVGQCKGGSGGSKDPYASLGPRNENNQIITLSATGLNSYYTVYSDGKNLDVTILTPGGAIDIIPDGKVDQKVYYQGGAITTPTVDTRVTYVNRSGKTCVIHVVRHY